MIYLNKIWHSRYFWLHLALSDLRARWRRSFFGVLWCIIQPLGMTLLLSLVFSKLFHTDIKYYALYIFSGVIIWEFILTTVINSSCSFIQASPYIKQCSHPLAIYTLRTTLSTITVLILASIPLFVWTFIVKPATFNFSWFAILSLYPLLIFILWPLATILAYIGARFRDLTPALSLIMQALWFVSPIYFEEKMFRAGGMDLLVDYNPIYHLLQIMRAPLLEGHLPNLENYLFCLVTIMVLVVIAIFTGLRCEHKVIFYL